MKIYGEQNKNPFGSHRPKEIGMLIPEVLVKDPGGANFSSIEWLRSDD